MNWRQSVFIGTALVVSVGLMGCGEDLPIASSEPEAVMLEIPYDEQRATSGARRYSNSCEGCHKADGLELSGNVTPIIQAIYGTESAVSENRLAERTARTMPEGFPESCDFECGLNIQHFFYREWTEKYRANVSASSTGSSTSQQSSSSSAGGITEEQVQERVAAGLGFYQTNSCAACHGESGQGVPEGNLSLRDSERTYQSLTFIIEDGAQGDAGLNMPPCEGVNCGPRIADYVWVEFLGGTLTESGGFR